MKALTRKQRLLLKVICRGNTDVTGVKISNVDYTQILSRLPYATSRESLMCSLRILENQGWMVKGGKELRDGRMKQTLEPTAQAIRIVTPPVAPVAKAEVGPEYAEFDLEDDVVVLEAL